jgi:tRNA 2-selenouridine synthase
MDATQPVFVESESKKVGNVAIPTSLVERMRASPCINLNLPEDERIELLLEDYDFFVQNTEFFCQRLDVLVEIRGKVVVENWKALVRQGNLRPVVAELLSKHYDPGYLQSIQRNFGLYDQALQLEIADRSEASLRAAAQSLLSR